MFTLTSEFTNIIQALIVVVLIGMTYSLWVTTHAYGGLIGNAIRYIGIGMILVAVVVLEKMLINFSVVTNSANLQLAQDALTLLSLLFLSMGFKRLANIAKG
jgi:Na+-translocating ferredoxin:NAD+ oxidoreductase RnfD subunit